MFGPVINLIFAVALTLAVGMWMRKHLHRRDWPIGAVFLVAVALSGYFGFRLVDRALYWANPAHHAMTPEPWMSPRMIERSWDLPPRSLVGVIGMQPEQTKGLSLADIARRNGEPVEVLIARITKALPAETPTSSDQP